jgi:hypothetical protein
MGTISRAQFECTVYLPDRTNLIVQSPDAIRKASRYLGFDLDQSVTNQILTGHDKEYEILLSRARLLVQNLAPLKLLPTRVKIVDVMFDSKLGDTL